MDFEEQLEKAEKLASPSLVGSSLRSADDSSHQNYIHPEKYTGNKTKPSKLSFQNSDTGASLDDLISEGALLGSEEDFDRFLSDEGSVKPSAKASESPKAESVEPAEPAVIHKHSSLRHEVTAEEVETVPEVRIDQEEPAEGLYENDNYSAPNLSEYQLEHQIGDHTELLDSVKSYDLSKLPSSGDRERSKTSELYAATERIPKNAKASPNKKNPAFAKLDFGENARVQETDSLHAPYFQRDERLPGRSRLEASQERSRSRSSNRPHLARGDSYKNTHSDAPTKYELPADMQVDEEEEATDRRSRQSRPTMGESIAAAEAAKDSYGENITRDPSLVTTGDYTNFNADAPSRKLDERTLYLVRSEASTNYLRSISRSRSRQPTSTRLGHGHSLLAEHNEKNDANPEELAKEGALVSDDPYDQVGDIDSLMKKVLTTKADDVDQASNAKQEYVESETPAETEDAEEPEVAEEKEVSEQDLEETAPLAIAKAATEEEQGHVGEEETEKEVTEDEVPSTGEVETEVTKTGEIATEPESTESEKVVTDEEASEVHAGTEAVEAESEVAEVDSQGVPTETVALKETEEPVEENSEETAADKAVKESELEESEETKTLELATSKDIEATEAPTEKELADTTSTVTESVSAVEVPEAETKDETSHVTKDLESDVTAEEAESEVTTEEAKSEVSTKEAESEVSTKEAESDVTAEALTPEAIAEDVEPKATTEDTAVTKDLEVSKELEPEVTTTAPEVPADEDYDVSPEELRKHLESLPIYIFTSLAGGMQIVHKTNRIATILQANGVKFEYRDLGTDEDAKKLWRRYAQGKLLPGVVRGDDVIGNLDDIEEANEEYRLREVLYETL